jgi:rod shape-determining protein MreD
MGDTQSARKIEEHIIHEALVLLALIGVALVQTSLLPTPLSFPPALMLVLVVCRVLVGLGAAMPEVAVGHGIRWAFYGGLALDVCAATPLGSHALALLLACLLVLLFAGRLRVGGALLPLLAVLLASLVYESVLALVHQQAVASIEWQQYALVIILPSVLLTLIPTLPIFHLLRWYYQER